MNDTIVAIATPPGRGGVGIVRLSGINLAPYILGLLRLPGNASLEPRHARFCGFHDENGGLLDQGLALYFEAPSSFTGESILELHAHGSPALLELLLQRAVCIGARLAEPGEFTKRAFLNGKIDLAQAEATADLIAAATTTAARAAVRSLTGEFSTQINDLVDQLIQLRSLTEATLDFPEEEIDFLDRYHASQRMNFIQEQLQQILRKARSSVLLSQGIRIVLIGEPNVGKSSLLNRLAGQDLAIVTPVPGTTRDPIRQLIEIQGVPVHIIDTAGLRQTDDLIEKMGIQRTWAAIKQADLAILLQESSLGHDEMANEQLPDFFSQLPPNFPYMRVYNKIDLCAVKPRKELINYIPQIWLSARTGEGVDLLEQEILNFVGWQGQEETTFLARERHVNALKQTLDCLQRAKEQMGQLELFAEELRLAQELLGSITGKFSADDLLGKIFSQFCIGK